MDRTRETTTARQYQESPAVQDQAETQKSAETELASWQKLPVIASIVAYWRRIAPERLYLRGRVYEVIEVGRGADKGSQVFDSFIITLILLNIAAFMLETVPSLQRQYGQYFLAFEIFSVVTFTLEYALRLWTAVEVPFLRRMSPLKARLRFARRPFLIIDLLAIAPFYLGWLFAVDLRVLRVLRLLRFLKLSRYSPAMHTLMRVFYNERRALMGAGLLLLGMLLLASTGIYYIEHKVQPDHFGSVPAAAWWAMATLTTVGYGDVAPVTPLGQFFGAFVMICGLCVLALPIAIISAGFSQEVGRRDFVVTWSLMSRIPLLAELESQELAVIMPMLHAHNHPPHTEVIAAGSSGDAMFFVAAGEVQLRTKTSTTDYKTGDFFGVVALIEGDVHAGAFVTTQNSRLLKLYLDDFHRLETANPEIAAHIRKIALARKAARDEQERKAAQTSKKQAEKE